MLQIYDIAKLSKCMKKELDDERYRHTLGVMYTAAALAMCHGADIAKAQVAGLLHDCAKCIPNDRKKKLSEKYEIPVNDAERLIPSLLHAKLGACLAKKQYQVEDEQILEAIRWHTTGKPDMSLLEKIIFIADYIEPMRWKAENLAQIRKEAFRDLDLAVFHTLRDTLRFLGRSPALIDDMTEQALAWYEGLCEKKGQL